MNVKIAPSILSADFACLRAGIEKVEQAGADVVHVDVMDGHFVPNITIGPPVVNSLKAQTKLPLDVHLMISQPELYIERFAVAGADWISVHCEATNHLNRLVQQMRAVKVRVGVALNPATPAAMLDEIWDKIDYVLVMTVNPGFGGQKFIPGSLDKIKRVSERLAGLSHKVEVEVDGGIGPANAAAVTAAGADILVAGSAVFGQPDPAAAVRQIRAAGNTSKSP